MKSQVRKENQPFHLLARLAPGLLLALVAVWLALALRASGAIAQAPPGSTAGADSVVVEYHFTGVEAGLSAMIDRASLFISVSNASSSTATSVGLVGVFPSRDVMAQPYFPGVLAGLRVPDLGWILPTGQAIQAGVVPTESVAVVLKLAPGEVKEIEIPYRLAQVLEPDTQVTTQVGFCAIDVNGVCPGADPGATVPPTSFIWLDPLPLTVRYRDLGDAPDSTNHQGTTMLAYPGVQANFPTVYDPATGAEQGPAHLDPRPFHLGYKSSAEAEADTGPDEDRYNNIEPNTVFSNLDRRDDGLYYPRFSFDHCATRSFGIHVLIHPAAVAYFQQTGGTGYLNAWVDGNRDGDWADTIQCTSSPDTYAIEHFIIDYPVDVVALGVGYHTLAVPSGLLPWPAAGEDKPAWVRLTLSERPSNKTLNIGGIDYGDGRGFPSPFVSGETEDYFYLPPSFQGLDISLDSWLKFIPTTIPQNGLSRAPQALPNAARIDVSLAGQAQGRQLIGINCRGHLITMSAISPTFSFDPDPAAGVHGFQDGNQVIYDFVGVDRIELPPISVLFAPPTSTTSAPNMADSIGVTVTLKCDEDINPADDQVTFDLAPGLPAPTLIWGDPHVPEHNSGLTCFQGLEIKGHSLPGAALHIFADGSEVGVVDADVDGYFHTQGTFADDWHRVYARAELGGLVSPFSNRLSIGVNSNLLWNPASLAFVDSRGRTFRPFDGNSNGMAVADDWQMRLKAGETYGVRVGYCGDDPAAEFALKMAGSTVALTDPDDDDIFEGTLTIPAAPLAGRQGMTAVTMTITSGLTANTYAGVIRHETEGLVYDALSGQPLAGAEVTVWQAVEASGDMEPAYFVWPGDEFGQANPQYTDADGRFAFWAPSGTYRLEVSKEGYQPYRTVDLGIVDEWLKADVPLAPLPDEGKVYQVRIGHDGFDLPVLAVRPGSVIEWINFDVQEHTVTSNGHWDSGLLASGESFRFGTTDEGTFAYVDEANPLNTGDLVVDVNAPAPYQFFLPLVFK